MFAGHINTKVLMNQSAKIDGLKIWETKTSVIKAGEGGLFFLSFTIHARRLTDKWMAAGVRGRVLEQGHLHSQGTNWKCWLLPASLVFLFPLSREKYYSRKPELFMHYKITPCVGQNETFAGDDGHRMLRPELQLEKKVMWSEAHTINKSHLTASTCFNSGHYRCVTAELWL